MADTAIQYRRGMTLGDFRTMMEQRAEACDHPFDNVERTVRAGHPKLRPNVTVFVVSYQCGDCGADLGRDTKRIKS